MRFSPFVERISGQGVAAWDIHYRALALREQGEVLAVDGTRVKTVFGIGQALKSRNPGDRVEVRLRRVEWDGMKPQSRELTVTVELESRAALMGRAKPR